MSRTRAKNGVAARIGARPGGRRRVCRAARRAGRALGQAWTWLTVFGPRAALRHWLPRLRRRTSAPRRSGQASSFALRLPQRIASAARGWAAWADRRPGLAAVALTGATAAAVTAGFVGLALAPAPQLEGDASPAPALPVLPVISSDFDGLPLETYLAPSLAGLERDDLLASSVLEDPEFARAVHWWVGYWTGPASRWFPGFLERMADRGSTVDSALATRGFPPSLRYLPLIESGYDPRVTSRTGAVGMWQLMPSTARGLGLQVSALVDERRHPERSTEAALEYLDALRGEFDSWFLTLAAYNSGPTRVRGILRRYAPDQPFSDSLFWALRNRFPVETREFVPKLYGAMWVASRPEAYGYGPESSPSLDK